MAKNNILLSIIVPTLNNGSEFEKFLKSLANQSFSKKKMEIIISDGGSTDNTLDLARKFGARIIHNKEVFADIGVNLGIKNAKGNLMMVLATDNIFKSKNDISKIVTVFKNEKIYAAFPKQTYAKSDSIFTKYINTFTDPANHFVYGYAANPRTFDRLYSCLERKKDYIIFDYKSDKSVPLVAFAQGFTVRKEFHRSRKNAFDDVAPVQELIVKNKKIAYVYSVNLYHHTISNLAHFVRKQSWRTKNFLEKKNFGIFHRVNALSKSQTLRFRIWPCYSLSILPPFIYALYYLIKDREKMWIYHPLLCIISGYTSLITFLVYKLKK